jgi:hypothetical protein
MPGRLFTYTRLQELPPAAGCKLIKIAKSVTATYSGNNGHP